MWATIVCQQSLRAARQYVVTDFVNVFFYMYIHVQFTRSSINVTERLKDLCKSARVQTESVSCHDFKHFRHHFSLLQRYFH